MKQTNEMPGIGHTIAYCLTILLAVAMVVAVVYVQSSTWLRHQQVQGCMEVSSYTFSNGEGVTTVEPIETSYTKCLELKQ